MRTTKEDFKNEDFSRTEHKRVAQDVINHMIEENIEDEYGDVMEMSTDEFENSLDRVEYALMQISGSELLDSWLPVGEWIASRNLDPDNQFKKMVNGEKVDYGYKNYRYDLPYNNINQQE